jgi:site-specific recombinase XerD
MDGRTERLVEGWLARDLAANTRSAYRHDFEGFVGWCRATGRRPLAADRGDIDAYRDHCLSGGAGSASVARRLSGIASFFRYAAAAGAVSGDPVDGVDRPTSPDPAESPVLGGDEVAGLVASASGLGAKAAALVAILALDGLKLGETLAMDVGDASLGPPSAWVAVTRRGQRTEVPISAATANLLGAYIGRRRTGPLFLGDSPVPHAGGPARLTRFGADFILKRAGSAAGIPTPVSAAVLRRSFIAEAHRSGRPITEITRQVGHRDVRETSRFLPKK